MFITFSSSDEQRNIGMNSNSETSCVAVDGFGAKTISLTAHGIVTLNAITTLRKMTLNTF
jgi:hypothetical protein